MHSLPHTSSWDSAQLVKHKDNFDFAVDFNIFALSCSDYGKIKVKISLLQAVEAHRVARG
jgi:hypothetical protein